MTLGSIFGLLFATLLPPFQVPDEPAHFYRSMAISGGVCVSPIRQSVPVALIHLQDEFPAGIEEIRPLQLTEYLRLVRAGSTTGERADVRNAAANAYSCVPYLASAAGIKIAEFLSQPALLLLLSARLANLALYLALVYVALRIIPVGRLALFFLALMPMTLQQAASASADSATIASAFLLFAYVAYLALDQRVVSIGNHHLVSLGGLLVITVLCKFNFWFLLLLLLIPSSKLGSARKKTLVVGALCAMTVLVLLSWQSLNSANLSVLSDTRAERGIDVAGNIHFILQQPLEFLMAVCRTLRTARDLYRNEFVGMLGTVSIALPNWLTWAYLVALALAVLADGKIDIAPSGKIICAVAAVGSVCSIFMLLWVLEMPREYLAREILVTQRSLIPGVQGRYFIPLIPLLFPVLSGLRIRSIAGLIATVCVGFVLLTNAVGLSRIQRTYFYMVNTNVSRAGLYRSGIWILDANGKHQLSVRGATRFGGVAGDIPVLGDWNGDGHRKIGIYRRGEWILGWDGDGQLTPRDRIFSFGGLQGDIPVTGDWTGDGHTKVGIYRNGAWILDLNGNGVFEPAIDLVLHFGGIPADIPVVGNWDGGGKSQIGIYRKGLWLLDSNGNGQFDDSDSPNPDQKIFFGGRFGDVPIVGDWRGERKPTLGIVRAGSEWFLDLRNDHKPPLGPPDFAFGNQDYIPLVGPWAPQY